MDTIKLNKENNPAVRMIGHQGIHHLEVGNTCSGFVAAGNRTYWGVETDVHVTADGEFIIIHDDDTGRVAMQKQTTDGSTLSVPLNATGVLVVRTSTGISYRVLNP